MNCFRRLIQEMIHRGLILSTITFETRVYLNLPGRFVIEME